MSERIAIYPGSFDPLHNGHLDLIERGCALFDRLHVAVLYNEKKKPLFSVEERIELIERATTGLANCQIESFSGLLVDYAESVGAQAIVRGLRAPGDFDFELQMALMNRKLKPGLETLFLAPRADLTYVSSSLLKEVYSLGGEAPELLPAEIHQELLRRLQAGDGG